MTYAVLDRSVHDAGHTAVVVPYGLGKCCETKTADRRETLPWTTTMKTTTATLD